MNQTYQLSCESTVDLPYSYVSGRGMSVLFYTYSVDGVEYVDDMGRDPAAHETFYRQLAEGKMPSTSQINTYRYTEYFRDLLQEGDVLHIAFGSGMTPSVNNAREAAKVLESEFPHRRLLIVDSLCSSSGYGLLTDIAADLWEAGVSMDEVEAHLLSVCNKIHHNFFVPDLTMLRRGGRISGATSVVATVLGICPTLRLNAAGRIVSEGKARGKKRAAEAIVNSMVENVEGDLAYGGKCYISHANAPDSAQITCALIEERFPNLRGKIRILELGTTIVSHCGPGVVALFYMGKERAE